jgi:hypothetical protein
MEICGAVALTGALPPAGSEATLKPAIAKSASATPAQQRKRPKSARKLKKAEREEDFEDFFFMSMFYFRTFKM